MLAQIALWMLVATVPAQAHGGGTPQLTGAEAGPYRVYAWSSPEPWRVGDAHIDVAVARPAADGIGEIPVMDADVMVRITGPDNAPLYNLAAQPLTYLNSFYYEVEFGLPEPGEYQVEVTVNNPDGQGSAEFPMEVLPPREINWLLIGGGTLVLLVAIALGTLWTRQAPRPTPNSAARQRSRHTLA